MTPLFVDSQAASQRTAVGSQDADVSMMDTQFVRATQEGVQFTPTQQGHSLASRVSLILEFTAFFRKT